MAKKISNKEDRDMEAEKLKVIAEGMGYYINPSMEDGITVDINGHWFDYNPDTTNNDQMVEVLTKLINLGGLLDSCHIKDENNFMIWMDNPEKRWEGKTINEAVCNAAYEYFKAKK